MKARLLQILTAVLVLFSIGVQAKKVHTIGDSTMAPYDESATVTRGWGMYFGNFLTNGWTSVNYAKGGRDARGGYNELWQNAKNNVEAGDYVLIQFAHNDEKINGVDRDELYDYYVAKGMTAEAAALDTRGTTPSTTYKAWLKKIVDEVKAKGANPVLVAPVCRSYFTGAKIRRNGRHDLGDNYQVLTANGLQAGTKLAETDHTMDYPYHMKALATELSVPYVDLTTATQELYESYGDTKCHEQLFDGDGSTHFNTTGALLVARLCAQLMQQQNILADDIVVPTDLSISPAEADMGDAYKGQTIVKELTLNGFGLTPAEGTIKIEATDGITLSLDKTTWSNQVSVDYHNGTLVQSFYARVVALEAGKVSGTITATLGSKTVEVPLTLNVIELGGGEPASVTWAFTSNDDAVTVGGMIAGDVTYNMLKKYGNNADMGVLAYVDQWTAAEDDDPGRYISMSVKCPEGKKLDINSIEMEVGARGGSGMKCHVYYSTDGFQTRTTIYAPTSMTSNVMNPVSATPVISLEEGEELQIRVYPWYTSDATGKYICVRNVTIGGQAKDANGLNIDGTIIYTLSEGGLDQGDDAVFEPTEMSAGFVAKKWTAGSELTVEGTKEYRGKGSDRTTMTRILNESGASLAGTATAGNTLTLTLTPEDGYYFMPTNISFEGARFGTDGGNLTVIAETGDKKETLCENEGVNRDGKELDIAKFSYTLASLMATADEPLKLNFSFINLGDTKEMGLSNLVIEGHLSGSATQTTKYLLNTAVVPAEAGTIEVTPDMTAYKEGTAVTLTAKRNFGYRFKEWQDATGAVVSTNATTTITMDAEKTMKAVFETIPVYTVSTRVTNDEDRTLGSVTLSPNDHNGQYEAGTEITVTANESPILKFMQWTDEFENAGTQAARTLTVNSNMTLVANYEVQDFIAVFDASVNNMYAYETTSGYPFAADIAWDNQRNAQSAVVKVADGSLAYTQNGGTPVVRNRTGVVLSAINGLYQNGYRTTDIAFQYQFSTVGFTSATFTADMAAKNMASKHWQALLSVDGGDFEQIEKWDATANVVIPLNITLPETAVGKDKVVLRITGDGDEMLSSSYQFDKTFDGLAYCDHSESGVGNVYVLGTAIVEEDNEAPQVVSTLPADGATNVSAFGRITISYNERIKAGSVNGKVTLTGNGTTMELTPEWNSRSVSFNYQPLQYGGTYTFEMPAGYVQDRSGNAADGSQITFTVMQRTQPTARVYDAVVAQDGTGDYTTVQAAIDAAPASRIKPWLIFVKNGSYNEHIDIPANKPYLHIIGQDRDKAVILDDKLCGGDNALHVSVGATVVVKADNIFFENITLENSYGHEKQAGPQALALNTMGDRIALNNVALLSYQDTWITSSTSNNRHYIKNSLIEGAVDFIYNSGNVYLDGDTLEINRPSGGYIVAPSHGADVKWGYVFQNNVIRAHPGVNVTDVWLGRPWHNQPKTVFINTQTFVNIPAKGWYNTMGGLPTLWADYNTVDANGNPLDLSQREDTYFYTDSDGNRVEGKAKNYLTDEEAAQYTIANVMSGDDNWQPDLMCEPCDAPVLTVSGNKLAWEAVPYAICYVVTRNGEVAGFTTDTEFVCTENGTWQVQAVNEFGGLSQKATASVTTGISDVNDQTSVQVIYTLDGRKVAHTQRGVNIIRTSDNSVRKVMVK